MFAVVVLCVKCSQPFGDLACVAGVKRGGGRGGGREFRQKTEDQGGGGGKRTRSLPSSAPPFFFSFPPPLPPPLYTPATQAIGDFTFIYLLLLFLPLYSSIFPSSESSSSGNEVRTNDKQDP